MVVGARGEFFSHGGHGILHAWSAWLRGGGGKVGSFLAMMEETESCHGHALMLPWWWGQGGGQGKSLVASNRSPHPSPWVRAT